MSEQDFTLGIDLGGTKILAAVVSPEGQILGRSKKRTRVDLGLAAVMDRVTRTAHEAVEASGIPLNKIKCVGIGAPGPIDWQTGILAETPNLGFKDFNIKQSMETSLGIATFAFNDVNAGTWGEYALGSGHGSSSCLGVFVGTGIGSGIIIRHKLYEGAGHFAGEIGHMCIKIHGPLCGCGRHGCLEALASRTAMTKDIWAAIAKGQKSILTSMTKKKGGQIRSGQLKKAYDEKDRVVCRVIDRAAECLGVGLGAAANLLNPESIVLGGGVVTALGAPYLDRVRSALEASTFKVVYDSLHLVQAALGDDAVLLGAAFLARQKPMLAKNKKSLRV